MGPARLREILTARRRLQWIATSLVATAITLVVAVPLTLRALDARNDDRPRSAPTDGIVVTLGATAGPLDGATITGAPVVSFDLPDTGATAFRLVDVVGNEVVDGTDTFGPDFTMYTTDDGLPAAFDTTEFSDGPYTIYVTFTLVDPLDDTTSEAYRMASFVIGNGP